LLTRERPAVTEVVAWAAGNGDRSENADYQCGKRRQIDGRIRFLTKRIEAAEVVDPEAPRAGQAATRTFFGATVRNANAAGASADRYIQATGDTETLEVLLPKFLDIIEHHQKGTDFGIGVDPADGLLRQGADGYQLTWMDAKVDDWVVTPPW
jgi:hypothetical protein